MTRRSIEANIHCARPRCPRPRPRGRFSRAGGAGAYLTGTTDTARADGAVSMTPPIPPQPLGSRGEVRPTRRRTRTFRPNYLSFAGTYQCNLSCPHCCVPIEWPDRLDIAVALRFLEDAHSEGVEIVGFTGGEPFL